MRDLYPHMPAGIQFLVDNPRAYLGDRMGLCKTAQSLIALTRVDVSRVLAVVPAVKVDDWHEERDEWGDPSWTYGVVSWSSRKDIKPGDWDAVILDEAHRAKTRKAQRTKKWLPVAAAAQRALLLSGTPMPNHPGELWTVFDAFWPELLKPEFRTEGKWFRYFCKFTMTKYGPRVYGVRNTKVLRALLAKIMLRRREVEGLPPLRITTYMLPRDAGFNESLAQAGIDGDALYTDIKGADDYARTRRLVGEYKAPRIGDIIAAELKGKEYDQIVVLYYHRAVGARLSETFEPFGCVGFNGASTPSARRHALKAFDAGEARVLCAQMTSAGEGLNLQVASEIVLVEPASSPDVNRQAIKRIHRPGQKCACRARLFGVAGSVDAVTMRMMRQRIEDQEEVGL